MRIATRRGLSGKVAVDPAMRSQASDPAGGAPAPHDDERASKPLVPGCDPFYLPPQGFEFTSPGAVLRTRSVRLAFMGLIRQRVAARQLLYRTSDLNGVPRAGVTTVLTPAQLGANVPTPIVSYQCAINAITGRCFPSYALRRGARAAGSLAQFEYVLITAALAEGWAVSVPDHEGADGAWGAPREPGHYVLDGLRASLNDEGLGLSRKAPIGLWGYSGGGLASAWAAELHATHAPDLNVVGAVLGSPVGDLGSTFRRLNGSLYAGLPAMVVAALSRVYPDLDRIIAAHATSRGKELLERLREQTTLHAIIRLALTDMDDLVDRPLEDILGSPEVQLIFEAIKLGTAAPRAPVLVIQAVHDKIVAVDAIDNLVDVYTAGGTHVTYHRDAFCEHLLLHTLSAPMSLRWLRERFEGKPLSTNCSRTRRPTVFNPSTYRGILRLVIICMRVITARRITLRRLSVLDR